VSSNPELRTNPSAAAGNRGYPAPSSTPAAKVPGWCAVGVAIEKMNRRRFFSLFGLAAAGAIVAAPKSYFFAPVGGWHRPGLVWHRMPSNLPSTPFLQSSVKGGSLVLSLPQGPVISLYPKSAWRILEDLAG